ncbi:hypothetical protein LE181_23050 [Streptomyces sp. SCA3-4]|uniref:hypothetical protein n=1 Tax=Streptomyces sichuanensis TaxID=2871810 RepID=UPI001CE37966|nr:hypothetical protein [Streptomyces sichuanensis]MCA6095036.1 hypothetical protein [Streptomyces sichuanensis]
MQTKNNRFLTVLAATLWVITLHAVGLCLVVVLMIAVWSAAAEHPAEAGGFLLQVAGVLAAGAALLSCVWYALKRAGLSPAARSAVTGALACPGPVALALYLYAGQ